MAGSTNSSLGILTAASSANNSHQTSNSGTQAAASSDAPSQNTTAAVASSAAPARISTAAAAVAARDAERDESYEERRRKRGSRRMCMYYNCGKYLNAENRSRTSPSFPPKPAIKKAGEIISAARWRTFARKKMAHSTFLERLGVAGNDPRSKRKEFRICAAHKLEPVQKTYKYEFVDPATKKRVLKTESDFFAVPCLPGPSIGPPPESRTAKRPLQLELYMDLVCPASCKVFMTLYKQVAHALKRKNEITFILYHVIQPWHPQSTLVHEVALAVKQLFKELYLDYVYAVCSAFVEDGKFNDNDTWSKSRSEIYEELLSVLEEMEKSKTVDLTALKLFLAPIRKGKHSGNLMSEQIKMATEYARRRGIHLTPTLFVNGVRVDDSTIGEWHMAEWIAFLKKREQDEIRDEYFSEHGKLVSEGTIAL